jgi:tetratricopeptide (TPR) repeat protein
MDSSIGNAIRPKLLALVARGRADQRALVEQLDETERSALGTPDSWSVKDYLAHLNFWRQQSLIRLAAAEHGETPPNVDDFEELNARNFEEQRLSEWSDILAESERLFAAVTTQLARFSEEELTDPQRYPWRNGQPLATAIIGNFFEHPAEHYTQLYRERGDMARAAAQQQAAVMTIGEIFGQSETYGDALYNLGCFHARNGEPERAIAAVRQALALNPTLVEWSKQDADLDTLRALPAFQALYTG